MVWYKTELGTFSQKHSFPTTVISTITNHPMYFSTNRFVNLKSLSIEADGCVVVHTTCTNVSDTKLKDNQQIADLNVIQNMFDQIDVKT